MFDVVSLGEVLIDFTPKGVSSDGKPLFEQNPGGAPANVLACVSRLGGKSAFIGKVGRDSFGRFLQEELVKSGIVSQGLRFSDVANTTLAFVHLNPDGDRSFSFYRNPGADTTLDIDEVDFSLIDNTRIFHFGSLSLTTEPSKSAAISTAEYARRKDCVVSYDPNLRLGLWPSVDAAREGIKSGLKYAHILKISEEELEFITGESDLERGTNLFYEMGIKLVVVTLGSGGCYYRYKGGTGHIPTYDTHVIDTTGSGDAFTGALLFRISRLECEFEDISKKDMEEILDFANAAGALCASRRGAIPAMPGMKEIQECIKNISKLDFKQL